MGKIGIVAFAFGVPSSIIANRTIGDIASIHAENYNFPIYTEPLIPIKNGLNVQFFDGGFNKPVSLFDLACAAADWAIYLGLEQIIIVTARPAVRRSKRDLKWALKKKGASRISIKVSPGISAYPLKFWFGCDCALARARYPLVWYLREMILVPMPMFLYKWAASYSNPLSKRF